MNKIKTTIEEQIEILKSRNVKFNIISEEEAKRFLVEKSYYFKISAYRENFDYRILKNSDISYKDLDFAYLKELSKIDMYLRYMILELTLDIEHYLKRWLINNATTDNNEDGHTIVNNFLSNNQDINNKLSQHANRLIALTYIRNTKETFLFGFLLKFLHLVIFFIFSIIIVILKILICLLIIKL